jgi:hypothetical protein
MPILHLGVIDVPYAPPAPTSKPPPKNPGRKSKIGPHRAHAQKYQNVTTGDVAGFLENRYHIMEHFWELHQDEIVDYLTDSLQDTIDNLAMGAPLTIDPYGAAMSKIEDAFKKMLANEELESMGYPGIPTMAALMGVSHRHKSGFLPRKVRQQALAAGESARPSFVDTGTYSASMKAWISS